VEIRMTGRTSGGILRVVCCGKLAAGVEALLRANDLVVVEGALCRFPDRKSGVWDFLMIASGVEKVIDLMLWELNLVPEEVG